MKNILIILLFAVLTPMTAPAQSSVNKFFSKHSSHEGAISVDVGGLLVKMVAKIAATEHEAAKILADINRLQVLVLEDGNPISSKEISSFVSNLQNDNFEELMTVREGETRVNFFIREEKDRITNVVILVSEADTFVLLNLKGKIKFSDLQKLDFDVKGSEHFKKIPKNKADVPKA
jgi:23S rRNA pseudoU1915 N3-methylase RlmH